MEPIPSSVITRDGGTLTVGQTYYTVSDYQVLCHTVSGIHRLGDNICPTFVVVSTDWAHHGMDCWASRDKAVVYCRERLEYLRGYHQTEGEKVAANLANLNKPTQQGE